MEYYFDEWIQFFGFVIVWYDVQGNIQIVCYNCCYYVFREVSYGLEVLFRVVIERVSEVEFFDGLGSVVDSFMFKEFFEV